MRESLGRRYTVHEGPGSTNEENRKLDVFDWMLESI